MISIYVCLNSKNLPHKWLLLCKYTLGLCVLISTLLALDATSQALVTQVKGEVTVQFSGSAKAVTLIPGTFLSEKSKLHFTTKSEIWLLCPGQDKVENIKVAKSKHELCPTTESSKMRGGQEDDIPFLIMPNQMALDKIDRVLWSGPKNGDYLIMLLQYDEMGSESLIKEWSTQTRIYHDSGYHEFVIEPPFPLPFPTNKSHTYKIEVENINTSKSSALVDEILINPITAKFPEHRLKEVQDLLTSQHVSRNSDLGKLILATYISGKGQFAEAYTLASTLGESAYQSAAQLLMARALYQPGTPSDIVVKKFAKVLKHSIANNDFTGATLACEYLLSPSNNLLDEELRDLRNRLVIHPDYAQYCK